MDHLNRDVAEYFVERLDELETWHNARLASQENSGENFDGSDDVVDPIHNSDIVGIRYADAAANFEHRLGEFLVQRTQAVEAMRYAAGAIWNHLVDRDPDSVREMGQQISRDSSSSAGAVGEDPDVLREVIIEGNGRELAQMLFNFVAEQRTLTRLIEAPTYEVWPWLASERRYREREWQTPHAPIWADSLVPPPSRRELRAAGLKDADGRVYLDWNGGANVYSIPLSGSFQQHSEATGGLVAAGSSGSLLLILESLYRLQPVLAKDFDISEIRLGLIGAGLVAQHHTLHELLSSSARWQHADRYGFTYVDDWWGRYRNLAPLTEEELRQHVATGGLFPDEIALGSSEPNILDDEVASGLDLIRALDVSESMWSWELQHDPEGNRLFPWIPATDEPRTRGEVWSRMWQARQGLALALEDVRTTLSPESRALARQRRLELDAAEEMMRQVGHDPAVIAERFRRFLEREVRPERSAVSVPAPVRGPVVLMADASDGVVRGLRQHLQDRIAGMWATRPGIPAEQMEETLADDPAVRRLLSLISARVSPETPSLEQSATQFVAAGPSSHHLSGPEQSLLTTAIQEYIQTGFPPAENSSTRETGASLGSEYASQQTASSQDNSLSRDHEELLEAGRGLQDLHLDHTESGVAVRDDQADSLVDGDAIGIRYAEAAAEFDQRLGEYLVQRPEAVDELRYAVSMVWNLIAERSSKSYRSRLRNLSSMGQPIKNDGAMVPGTVGQNFEVLAQAAQMGNGRELALMLFSIVSEQNILGRFIELPHYGNFPWLLVERQDRVVSQEQAGKVIPAESIVPPPSDREMDAAGHTDSDGRAYITWASGGSYLSMPMGSDFQQRSERTGGLVAAGSSGSLLLILESLYRLQPVLGVSFNMPEIRLGLIGANLVAGHHTAHELISTSAQWHHAQEYGFSYHDVWWDRYRSLAPITEAELRENVATDSLFPDEIALGAPAPFAFDQEIANGVDLLNALGVPEERWAQELTQDADGTTHTVQSVNGSSPLAVWSRMWQARQGLALALEDVRTTLSPESRALARQRRLELDAAEEMMRQVGHDPAVIGERFRRFLEREVRPERSAVSVPAPVRGPVVLMADASDGVVRGLRQHLQDRIAGMWATRPGIPAEQMEETLANDPAVRRLLSLISARVSPETPSLEQSATQFVAAGPSSHHLSGPEQSLLTTAIQEYIQTGFPPAENNSTLFHLENDHARPQVRSVGGELYSSGGLPSEPSTVGSAPDPANLSESFFDALIGRPQQTQLEPTRRYARDAGFYRDSRPLPQTQINPALSSSSAVINSRHGEYTDAAYGLRNDYQGRTSSAIPSDIQNHPVNPGPTRDWASRYTATQDHAASAATYIAVGPKGRGLDQMTAIALKLHYADPNHHGFMPPREKMIDFGDGKPFALHNRLERLIKEGRSSMHFELLNELQRAKLSPFRDNHGRWRINPQSASGKRPSNSKVAAAVRQYASKFDDLPPYDHQELVDGYWVNLQSHVIRPIVEEGGASLWAQIKKEVLSAGWARDRSDGSGRLRINQDLLYNRGSSGLPGRDRQRSWIEAPNPSSSDFLSLFEATKTHLRGIRESGAAYSALRSMSADDFVFTVDRFYEETLGRTFARESQLANQIAHWFAAEIRFPLAQPEDGQVQPLRRPRGPNLSAQGDRAVADALHYIYSDPDNYGYLPSKWAIVETEGQSRTRVLDRVNSIPRIRQLSPAMHKALLRAGFAPHRGPDGFWRISHSDASVAVTDPHVAGAVESYASKFPDLPNESHFERAGNSWISLEQDVIRPIMVDGGINLDQKIKGAVSRAGWAVPAADGSGAMLIRPAFLLTRGTAGLPGPERRPSWHEAPRPAWSDIEALLNDVMGELQTLPGAGDVYRAFRMMSPAAFAPVLERFYRELPGRTFWYQKQLARQIAHWLRFDAEAQIVGEDAFDVTLDQSSNGSAAIPHNTRQDVGAGHGELAYGDAARALARAQEDLAQAQEQAARGVGSSSRPDGRVQEALHRLQVAEHGMRRAELARAGLEMREESASLGNHPQTAGAPRMTAPQSDVATGERQGPGGSSWDRQVFMADAADSLRSGWLTVLHDRISATWDSREHSASSAAQLVEHLGADATALTVLRAFMNHLPAEALAQFPGATVPFEDGANALPAVSEPPKPGNDSQARPGLPITHREKALLHTLVQEHASLTGRHLAAGEPPAVQLRSTPDSDAAEVPQVTNLLPDATREARSDQPSTSLSHTTPDFASDRPLQQPVFHGELSTARPVTTETADHPLLGPTDDRYLLGIRPSFTYIDFHIDAALGHTELKLLFVEPKTMSADQKDRAFAALIERLGGDHPPLNQRRRIIVDHSYDFLNALTAVQEFVTRTNLGAYVLRNPDASDSLTSAAKERGQTIHLCPPA
ncbi:hypothetical protein [Streptomyces sp. NPDC090080]|uniref:hypothetical protein n=1 Tax=Streptomyces sp. NPDC090080 TaxID=3365939 RepID=UPI003829220E